MLAKWISQINIYKISKFSFAFYWKIRLAVSRHLAYPDQLLYNPYQNAIS
jgi:hypothetical protein